MSASLFPPVLVTANSVMIPWLLGLQVICERVQACRKLVGANRLFPPVANQPAADGDPKAILLACRGPREQGRAGSTSHDGLSLDFLMAFNLRSSNTDRSCA